MTPLLSLFYLITYWFILKYLIFQGSVLFWDTSFLATCQAGMEYTENYAIYTRLDSSVWVCKEALRSAKLSITVDCSFILRFEAEITLFLNNQRCVYTYIYFTGCL